MARGAPATTTWPGGSVAVTDAMTRTGLLSSTPVGLTDAGVAWLTDRVGMDPAALRHPRRPLARPCLDWTERRTHLAGLAGAQICAEFLQRHWIERIGTGRAVRVTASGATALRDLLGITDAEFAHSTSQDPRDG
jgi:hypothetical protein